MQRQEIHHRIIIAMAMHMVMQGMFNGLSDTLRHDVKRRYNIMNDQLSRFNKYMSRLDEPTSKHVLNKALEIAESALLIHVCVYQIN